MKPTVPFCYILTVLLVKFVKLPKLENQELKKQAGIQPFKGLLSGIICLAGTRIWHKGILFQISMKQQILGWQQHQMDNMQIICPSLQMDNHVGTSSLAYYRTNAFPDAHPTVYTHTVKMMKQTRNTFYGTRYLSHCYACFAFNPLFINWVTI